MKNIHMLLLQVLLCWFSSRTIAKEENPITHDTLPPSASIVDVMMELDFKHDYLCLPYKRLPYNAEQISFSKLFAPLDTLVMGKRYAEVKRRMADLLLDNEDGNNSPLVQRAALRYLREYFLLKTDEASLTETEYLLAILIETDGQDLDVMADAFAAVRERLPEARQEAYERQLRVLHDYHFSYVMDNWQRMRDLYLTAEDETEKVKYLFAGRDMERRSKSCSYVRNLLGWELEGSK
jgi:hypothetical protein